MSSVTYYAVLPFVRDDDGNLCPDEAVGLDVPQIVLAQADELID